MPPPCRILILNERDPRHPAAGGAEVHVAEISRRMSAMGHQLTQAAVGVPRGARARDAGRARGDPPRAHPLVLPARRPALRARDAPRTLRRGGRAPEQAALLRAAHSAVPVLAVAHHLFGRSAFLQAAWPVAAMVVATESLIPWVYRKTPFLAVSQSTKDDLVARGIARGPDRADPQRCPPARDAAAARSACGPAASPTSAGSNATSGSTCCCARSRPWRRACPRSRSRSSGAAAAAPSWSSSRASSASRRAPASPASPATSCATRCSPARASASALRVKEGWGITVVEANALGVPVVATDAPGLRDAVRHDETGLLVPDGPPDALVPRLADAILRLLSDEALATRLSAGALAWSRRFDWDTAAATMADAVERARTSLGQKAAARSVADGHQTRLLARTALEDLRAARVEAAARRGMGRRGHVALHVRAHPAPARDRPRARPPAAPRV